MPSINPGNKRSLKFFYNNLYGRVSHLGHVTQTIYTNFRSKLSMEAPHERLVIEKADSEKMLKRMVIYMYIHVPGSPGQGQTTPWRQNIFINHNLLLIWSFVASVPIN